MCCCHINRCVENQLSGVWSRRIQNIRMHSWRSSSTTLCSTARKVLPGKSYTMRSRKLNSVRESRVWIFFVRQLKMLPPWLKCAAGAWVERPIRFPLKFVQSVGRPWLSDGSFNKHQKGPTDQWRSDWRESFILLQREKVLRSRKKMTHTEWQSQIKHLHTSDCR